MGFSSVDELQEYVKNLIPAHAYYSTAYYRTPQAASMSDKAWLGADLIFDLDADHIMHGSYDLMLARIKEETEKLLAVLENELGFDMKTVRLVFSGGRGYHIHIQDIAFRSYGSQERRELVDYVCGIGINPGIMLREYIGGHPSWHERYREALQGYLQHLSALSTKEAIKEIKSMKGIGETKGERFIEMKDELIRQLNRDPRSVNTTDQTISSVLSALIEEKEGKLSGAVREAGVQADEPVTTDTRRLIRLPGSLHAKSGFRVTPLTLKELPDFDPLIDAVPFGEREIKIDSKGSYMIPLMGSRYEIQKGVQPVPEAVALFLCCRGMAEISGGTSGAS